MTDFSSFIGTVQDVKGAVVQVALDLSTISNLKFVDGHGYRIGQIGSFVRIPIGYRTLYGIVSQVGAGAVPDKLLELEPYGHRWMSVQLVGEEGGGFPFRRGVTQYPTIGDKVHLATESDLMKLYGGADGAFVKAGTIASAESIPAPIHVGTLVTRHSAVLGSTGSGKSTAVAGLLDRLTDEARFPSARVLVFDIHGEYAAAFGRKARVLRTNPAGGENRLCIPYWALSGEELLAVAFDGLDGSGGIAVLDKVVALKREALRFGGCEAVDPALVTVDTPVPFSIHKLWFDLYRAEIATHTVSGGQSDDNEALLLGADGRPVQPGDALKVVPPLYRPHTQAQGETKIYLSNRGKNIRRPLEALASRLRDPRYDFLFRPGDWSVDLEGRTGRDLDALLRVWIDGEEPVAVLDLSGIPGSVLDTLIGAITRMLYDSLFWARNVPEGGRERPLLVVMEEAHAYLGKDARGLAVEGVRRCVREGRKYGIGLMLVSQRPSEIDATILSQCGTLFAMRMNNAADRAHVMAAAPDHLDGLAAMLPALRTGEAIAIGEAVRLPMRMMFAPPPPGRRPDGDDPDVTGRWSAVRPPDDYREVLKLWRRQQARPLKFAEGLERRPVVTEGKEEAEMMRDAARSSLLLSIGYDAERMTLEVEFAQGRVYQYYDVPEHVYAALLAAESQGKFFNEHIRSRYRFGRV